MMLGTSCLAEAMRNDNVILKSDIEKKLCDIGYTVPMPLPDNMYYVPSFKELKEYLDVWEIKCRTLQQYKLEINDCDEFSDEFKVFVKRVFYKNNKNRTSPIAIFSVHACSNYNQSGVGHAFNLAVTFDEGLVYIEPFNGSVIKSFTVDDVKLVFVF